MNRFPNLTGGNRVFIVHKSASHASGQGERGRESQAEGAERMAEGEAQGGAHPWEKS